MGAAEQQDATGPQAGACVAQGGAGGFQRIELAVEKGKVASRGGGGAALADEFGLRVWIAFRLLVDDMVQHVAVVRRVTVVRDVEVQGVAAA